MLQTRFAVPLLASVALAVAGCGGTENAGRSDQSSMAQSSTVGQRGNGLVAQANAVCRQINTQRPPARSTAPVVPRMLQVAGIERREQAELARLNPPASLAGDWDRIVGDVHTIAVELPKLAEYTRLNKLGLGKARALMITLAEAEHDLLSTSRRDGLTDCGKFH